MITLSAAAQRKGWQLRDGRLERVIDKATGHIEICNRGSSTFAEICKTGKSEGTERERSASGGLMRVAGDEDDRFRSARPGLDTRIVAEARARRNHKPKSRLSNETEKLLARGRKLRAVADDEIGEAEVPELRADAKPSLTIVLNSRAQETISKELARSRDLFDLNFETGGFLFGIPDGKKWLVSATDLGAGKRRVNELKLDMNEVLYEAYRASLGPVGRAPRFLGAWHVHPAAGSTKPSAQDRRASGLRLQNRDLNPGPFALDLIISPHKARGWLGPEYTAWATHRNMFGGLVTEPVTIDWPTRR